MLIQQPDGSARVSASQTSRRCTPKCVQHIGLSQGRISAHLACLADCGYVQGRRAGRFAYHTVADPRVANLVMLARLLAADNAAALADCVRIAPATSAESAARPQ